MKKSNIKKWIIDGLGSSNLAIIGIGNIPIGLIAWVTSRARNYKFGGVISVAH
jgi:hypothetical protein